MNIHDEAIEQILFENNINHEWSKSVQHELKGINLSKDSRRKDLTDKPFITIDGSDAKDFDDAILCEHKGSQTVLSVAIADVADIVKLGSNLDNEARDRGTSIYFPAKVIPMLPEEISNNLCSLVPNEIRNVLVCKMVFADNGNIESYEFLEAAIKSQLRATYQSIDEVINKKAVLSEPIQRSVHALKNLTKVLLKRRTERQALEIDSDEPILNLDNSGNVIKIVTSKRLFSHLMIEESMLAANICAAKYMKKHYGFGVYRIHEEPEDIKIDALKNFFAAKGLTTKSKKDPLEIINQCLEFSKEHDLKKSLQTLVLQSLQRAEYSTEDIGHFGLQLKQYAHFTSPIRRYPDLMVHRLIKNKLYKKIDANLPNKEQIELDCCELSDLERRAEKASRTVVQQLICHHLKEYIGDEFNSIIVGVTDFGIFAEIDNFYISGLVHVSDLPGDRYIFDKISGVLKGKSSGRTFRQGQKIKVKINNVLPYERKINLSIISK